MFLWVIGICVFGALAYFVVFPLIRDGLRHSAEQLTVEVNRSILPPPDTTVISNWQGNYWESMDCYNGQSSTFYGSKKPLDEVIRQYHYEFVQMGWIELPCDSDLNAPDKRQQMELNQQEIYLRVDSGGEYRVTVDICDDDGCYSTHRTHGFYDLLDASKAKYITIYVVSIVYKSELTQNNLCGCCSGV